MYKVECPRCLGGKGHISAFSHIQGGVCFKCKGDGFILRKSKPVQSKWFLVYQLWTDPSDCNYNNGEYLRTSRIKARSKKEAEKKVDKFVKGKRPFYVEEEL